MDDNSNRTALAVLLSFMVIFFYYRQQDLKRTEVHTTPQQQTSTTLPSQHTTAPSPFEVPPQPEIETAQLKQPEIKHFLESSKTVVKTDNVEVEISHLGARLISYKLNHYKTTVKGTDPLNMIDKDNPIPPLGVYFGNINDSTAQYTLSSYTDGVQQSGGVFTLQGDQKLSLNFTATLSNGAVITKTLIFSNANYYFNVNVEVSISTENISNIWLEWTSFIPEGTKEENWNQKVYTLFSQDEDREIVTIRSLQPNFKTYMTKWSAFGDNYFLNAIIPTIQGQNTMLAARSGSGTLLFNRVAGDKGSAQFDVYAGPKRVDTLSVKPYKLESSIDLGRLAFIGQPILLILKLFYELLGNYGLAIVLLTLIIKTLLLPLNAKSFQSMRAMQDLKPEMDALRARIQDPNQLNQEVLALYKRKGVNPMGGCLPMLIQLPIFLGMYNALRTSFDLRHEPFTLWIDDLAAPESLPIFGINVPVMILVMSVTMFIQQLTTPSAGASPEQRKVMLFMPIMFTVMFLIWPFPSGLVLYWLVNNFISIIQQVALRSEGKITPLQVTFVGSAAIFGLCYVLTLL